MQRSPIFFENPPVEAIRIRGLAHQNAAGLEEAVGAMKCGHGIEHMLDDMPHAHKIKTSVSEIRIYQLAATHIQSRLFGTLRSLAIYLEPSKRLKPRPRMASSALPFPHPTSRMQTSLGTSWEICRASWANTASDIQLMIVSLL